MDYILTPNGELYHAKRGVEREDHKYVSREWKNGRWNYVYQTAKKSNSSGASKEYQSEVEYNSKTNDYGGASKGKSPASVKSLANTIKSTKAKYEGIIKALPKGSAPQMAKYAMEVKSANKSANKPAAKSESNITEKTDDVKVIKGKTSTSGISKVASAVGKKAAENTGLNQREDAIEKKREWNSAYAKERKSGSEADKLAHKVKQVELNAAHESLMNTPVGKIEKAIAEKAQVWLYRMQAEAKRSRR